MSVVVFILVVTVRVLLRVLFILFLIRSFLNLLPVDEDGKFALFINCVTEPIVIPFRMLCEKIPSLQTLPIDLSVLFASLTVLIAYFLLSLIPVSL